jgi:O-antigen/teichoic acid export membrane protein
MGANEAFQAALTIPVEGAEAGAGDRLRAMASRALGLARDVLYARDEAARVKRDALLAFVIRVASAAILYLSQVVLARWMGVHEYGVYVFVWTWVLVLGGLSALGFAGASLRLVPEYRERGEHSLIRGISWGGPLIAALAGSLVAGAGIAAIHLAGERLDGPYALPAMLILVALPLYALEDAMDGVARGHGWMALALVPPFILRPLLILAAMAGARLAGLELTAVTAAVAAVAAVWLAAIVQLVLVARRIRRETPSARPRTDARAWFRVSLPLVLVYACELAMQNTDVLVISRYMAPTDVGIYFAAAKTMSLILFVHYAVGSAVAARFSALNARGDRAGLQAFAREAAQWTFWPSLAAALLILALGQLLLSFFGPEFVAAFPVMLILVVGFLIRSAVGPADMLLSMAGEQKLCAALLVVMAGLNVALNLALVPSFGLVGAASATSTALAAGAVMSHLAAKRRLGVDMGVWRGCSGAA